MQVWNNQLQRSYRIQNAEGADFASLDLIVRKHAVLAPPVGDDVPREEVLVV